MKMYLSSSGCDVLNAWNACVCVGTRFCALKILLLLLLVFGRILPALHVFNTPLPQPDRYIFVYHRLTIVQRLFCRLEKEFTPKIRNVLYCHIKLAFLLTVYVLGPGFRTLAVIRVSVFLLIQYPVG